MRHRRMIHRLIFAALALIAVALVTTGAGRGVADSPMQDLSSSDQLRRDSSKIPVKLS
jgi:hypothetical protein